jgi:hypothetical protein
MGVEETRAGDDTSAVLFEGEYQEDLESLETLPAAEEELAAVPRTDVSVQELVDDGTAVDLGLYLGPCVHYRPYAGFDRTPASEELPVVGDGEPWSELEFIGDEDEYGFDGEEADFSTTDGGIIEYRDGVFRLNAELSTVGVPEDSKLRALVDSVLSGSSEPS